MSQPEIDYIAPDLRPLAVEVIELNPAPNNARKHELTKDIPVLKESLQRFGQRKAIVAKHLYYGVPNAVIAGNGTLLAAQALDWSHIAVSWFDGTDEEAQEFALIDNRTAELSEWDLGELAKQMKDIRDRGGDVGKLGWDAHEAEPLLRADWSPPAEASLPGGESKYRALSFTLDQWIIVEQAVERVRHGEHDSEMPPARCVELILSDYLAGPEVE